MKTHIRETVKKHLSVTYLPVRHFMIGSVMNLLLPGQQQKMCSGGQKVRLSITRRAFPSKRSIVFGSTSLISADIPSVLSTCCCNRSRNP